MELRFSRPHAACARGPTRSPGPAVEHLAPGTLLLTGAKQVELTGQFAANDVTPQAIAHTLRLQTSRTSIRGHV